MPEIIPTHAATVPCGVAGRFWKSLETNENISQHARHEIESFIARAAADFRCAVMI
jgi:hypothetical protein